MNEKNHALEQANAQMASVREMVARLELDWERLDELRHDRDTHNSMGEGYDRVWSETHEDEAQELAELEALADGCEDLEDAEQRILEDALSVEVRSGWTLPQAMHNAENWAEEFRIVLCTGGPHVQIRGELNGGVPSRAWLEYQDWGMPMTERVNDEGDQDALLAYARCFWFGE